MADVHASLSHTVSFSTPLPRTLDSHIHVRLTTRDKCLMLFLTSTTAEDSEATTALGSFVYAVPDVRNILPDIWTGRTELTHSTAV